MFVLGGYVEKCINGSLKVVELERRMRIWILLFFFDFDISVERFYFFVFIYVLFDWVIKMRFGVFSEKRRSRC